ncbi:helix-turn-helix domain-containing protein [Rhizobium sp. SL86]|uniref:helix-turn-helix domain-containing protein n=1 Tax=Rhizobium sp. SL86 TaxID=2995148 RepID=UPI002273F114|nr:helix-turn-helix transcriptional regulator [Rhizobium sp. SL86]MCY1668603.1 helix-turn-helix transcriptional regulator [Rhizobium sp. SL86]
MKRLSRGAFGAETLREIGERIRAARGAATQEDFARKIGVGRTVLANYEAGRRLPSSQTLEKIASTTGNTTAYILTGVEATKDPFIVDTIYSDTHLEEGYIVALFIFEKMRGSFLLKSEVERLRIWANVLPKLAEHLDDVIGANVNINDSDWATELEALIEEFRNTPTEDILELIVSLNTQVRPT